MKFETRAIRLRSDLTSQKEHSSPLYLTSSFLFDNAEEMRSVFAGEQEGNIYSRFSNPSVEEFENKMASLENGEKCLATASGMAAIFTCFASLLSSGDHLLMSQAVFGSTFKITENFFQKWGITYDYVDQREPNDWQRFVTPNTKLLYLETPSNPGLDIIDLSQASKFCKEHDILLIVDNCFATPYLQQPLDLEQT